MATIVNDDKIYLAEDLKRSAAKQLQQLIDFPILADSKILRYEFKCSDIDPIIWLHNQKVDIKAYWSDRKNDFQTGGVGEAHVVQGFEKNIDYKKIFNQCQSHLSSKYPYVRYYGGLNFSQLKQSPEWESYGSYRFVVPQFELVKVADETFFAVNILNDESLTEMVGDYLRKLEDIEFDSTTKFKKVPKVLSRSDFPDKDNWGALCGRVIEQEINTRYEKIVLARKSIFEFDVPINPVALTKHLKDMTPHCFHFCFQLADNEGFLGATPERLLKFSEGAIKTEAIAGTIERGKTEEEDKQLANELLNSEKDRLEHVFVVEDIKRSLKDVCETLDVNKEFTLMKLKGGQHLVTRINGRLKTDVKESDVLALLHPTPAVAGCPTDVCVRAINEMEEFDRGWYAGPVGYIGHAQSEFAVGIRSGLVSQHHLSLYAGAGIVKGSTAETEWNEIENKISRFIKVFDV